jgi:hypothetical protein
MDGYTSTKLMERPASASWMRIVSVLVHPLEFETYVLSFSKDLLRLLESVKLSFNSRHLQSGAGGGARGGEGSSSAGHKCDCESELHGDRYI